MSDRLGPLEEISRMLLDAELAKLQRLSEETRVRQAEAARLGDVLAARAAEMKNADPVDDLALRSGQDARWQAWMADRRKQLSREAAEIAARREAQRLKTQAAFGQVEALKGLRLAEVAERRQQAARGLYADPDAGAPTGE